MAITKWYISINDEDAKMKVYVVGTVAAYLGSEVYQLGIFEQELEKEPDFDKVHYDKMGNSEKTWKYFKTQKDADSAFIKLFRGLKETKGLEKFPKDWRDQYEKFYQRASKDYPEII